VFSLIQIDCTGGRITTSSSQRIQCFFAAGAVIKPRVRMDCLMQREAGAGSDRTPILDKLVVGVAIARRPP